jgi:hypothetical protein
MESTAIAFLAAVAAMLPVSGSVTTSNTGCTSATSVPAIAATFEYHNTAAREDSSELTDYEAWLIAQHHAAGASASWMFAPAERPARHCAEPPQHSAAR